MLDDELAVSAAYRTARERGRAHSGPPAAHVCRLDL
jgi:hypothetical protein